MAGLAGTHILNAIHIDGEVWLYLKGVLLRSLRYVELQFLVIELRYIWLGVVEGEMSDGGLTWCR